MAYSFTEPENKKNGKDDSAENEDEEDEDDEESEKMRPPMMVPMADVLNHITKHNAKLTFGSEALKMVTTRDISMVCALRLNTAFINEKSKSFTL